ncbi:NAD(P)/FAD-dependent oxidoreductase [Actinokineospora iranica]|uniref:Dehydrogenase (Flavoprotein) n=1 Tax=Actinokineospora iranica TaxID=1271860 RepID=A0A1G6TYW5_9PSEU|nr:NAD(P)/FAD-dependent oxidoreductase [Actinokineospora iranica]SDD34279.1 Dehydrogenase (flavoprotein) [Actinokineospora iranica]
MYDVIVVGARCAGSPVAMLLARRGHRVLVVDRSTFPSDTVSTHYIHQAGLSRLKSWGLLDKVVATGVPAIRKLNFSYTGISLAGFADPIEGVDAVYCPRRTVLDEILVGGAREAGAEVIEGFTVTDVLFEDGRAVGIRGRAGDGPEREFRSTVVVGADGRGSIVAEKVGAEFYRVVPAAGFIYYSYHSGLDWGMHHRTGFGEQQIGTWPTNDGLNLLAIIRGRERFGEFRADVEGSFQEVFDQVVPEMGAELRSKGKREEPWRPMRYPDNYYRTSAGPGWALVGDAGYHKDPFTGWGITDAFKYGEVLADRLHEALSGERAMDEAMADYIKVRDEESSGTFELTCTLAKLQLTPFYDSVFRATSQSPAYTKKFFGLIAGGVHGEEFFAPGHLEELYDEVGMPADERRYSPS